MIDTAYFTTACAGSALRIISRFENSPVDENPLIMRLQSHQARPANETETQ